MPDAAIRADLDQALDVKRHLAAQVTLDLVPPVDHLAEPVDLFFGQVRTRVSGLMFVWARIFWLVGSPIPKT